MFAITGDNGNTIAKPSYWAWQVEWEQSIAVDWIKGFLQNSEKFTEYESQREQHPKHCKYKNKDEHIGLNSKMIISKIMIYMYFKDLLNIFAWGL